MREGCAIGTKFSWRGAQQTWRVQTIGCDFWQCLHEGSPSDRLSTDPFIPCARAASGRAAAGCAEHVAHEAPRVEAGRASDGLRTKRILEEDVLYEITRREANPPNAGGSRFAEYMLLGSKWHALPDPAPLVQVYMPERLRSDEARHERGPAIASPACIG